MKKHKGLIICLGVLLILGIAACIGIKKLVFPDDNKSKYGNRLDGIENVPISDETKNEMKESFLKNENVIDFNYNLTGKIIKITIKVKKETKQDDAKILGDIILKNLSDDQKKFYDIEYSVVCEEDNDLYPIMGSKHRTSETFSWTIKKIKEEKQGGENAE